MPMVGAKKTASQNQLSSLRLKEGTAEVKRSPGRPLTGDAKKGNPEYKLTSVYLPKQIYADAQGILLRSNAAKDEKQTVSDLFSTFLTQWVKEQLGR